MAKKTQRTKEENDVIAKAKAENPLTIEQQIEQYQMQYKEAIEVSLRCEGAITVLNVLLKEKK